MSFYIAVFLLLFLGGLTIFVFSSKLIYPLYLMIEENRLIKNYKETKTVKQQ